MKLIIFMLISTWASAQVVLPDSIARFYLERNEIASILESRHSLMSKLVENYEAEIKDKDLIIQSYKIDYDSQDKYLEDLNWQINSLQKEVKREKIKKNVFVAFSVLIFVLLQ
jgi:hypothetical protein